MLFMYRLSGAEQHLQPVGQVKAAAAQRSHNPLCLLTHCWSQWDCFD